MRALRSIIREAGQPPQDADVDIDAPVRAPDGAFPLERTEGDVDLGPTRADQLAELRLRQRKRARLRRIPAAPGRDIRKDEAGQTLLDRMERDRLELVSRVAQPPAQEPDNAFRERRSGREQA